MPRHPLDRIPIRMFLYGVTLGSLTVEVMRIVYQLTYSQTVPVVSFEILIFDLFFGLIFGGISGIISGIAIFLIVKWTLRRQASLNDVHFCRDLSGFITASITGIILSPLFLVSLVFLLYGDVILLFTLIISVGNGVYMGQHTITKYLREIDVRKKKVS